MNSARLALLGTALVALPLCAAQAEVTGWQIASTPDRCLAFNTLGSGPPLQIGLLHQRGGPWVTLFGSDATASLAEGGKVTVRFDYEGGFARREFAAETRRIGQSVMLSIMSAPAAFRGFDPADISAPQALLLVAELNKPFTLEDAEGAVLAKGEVPAGLEPAFREFLACADKIDAAPAGSVPAPRRGMQGPPSGPQPIGR